MECELICNDITAKIQPREIESIVGLAKGLRSDELAESMGILPSSVRVLWYNARRKLGKFDNRALVRWARDNGHLEGVEIAI